MKAIIFSVVVLLLLAAPAVADPPTWWGETVRYLHDNNMTEINTTCWMDSAGGYHAAVLNSTTYRSNIFGFEYGDCFQHYTYALDGVVVVDGIADLTERELAHEYGVQASLDLVGQAVSYWPYWGALSFMSIVVMYLVLCIPDDEEQDEA